tara:strand:+ start:1278 stop:1418 length:141 start_codon:yes stop_codon:yes gene_type:complete
MKTAVIIKHDHEEKWLVLKYLGEDLVGENWCDNEDAANVVKTGWEN